MFIQERLCQLFPKGIEGDEWLFSLEVPVSIQSDHLPIRDDLDDNILSDAAIILIIIRGRSVPCAINRITVAVVIGLVYRLEHILAEACVFKQKSELDRFHSSFLRSNNHRFFLDRAVFWLW